MNPLGASSTTEDVLAGANLPGKRILVTGVSAGIGVETARALAVHGAEVIGTGRDLAKGDRALREARAEAEANGGSVNLISVDLASLASVRAAADRLIAEGRPIDVVIANAGVGALPFGLTADGFEIQFGTNHLGHFLLVNRLAPLIREGGRLVNLASSGHRIADIDLDDPNFERTRYDPFIAYGRSKTANILFTVEFDRRHQSRGVRATAVHPGSVETELSRHMPPGQFEAMIERRNAELAAQGRAPSRPKSLAQGAATSVWAAVVAPASEIGGRYCENCHVSAIVGDEPLDLATEGVRAYALDPSRAKALWAKSEDMIGERF
jgi:NAD(P)-dependent dehydrogenase (short-subunit alcohol dehydrogenase family)